MCFRDPQPAAAGSERATAFRRCEIITFQTFLAVAWIFILLALSTGSAVAETDASATNQILSSSSVLDPKFGVGSWIWAAETHDQQLCRFWRGFEIPSGVRAVKAHLRITADNSFKLFVDGREIGRGGEWRDLIEFDLALLLTPGTHVLAVEAFNDWDMAGLLVGLSIELTDGTTLEIGSDESWRVVPLTEKRWETRRHPSPEWPAATIVSPFGKAGKALWFKQGMAHIVTTPPVLPETTQFWQAAWFQITLLSLCVVVVAVSLWLTSQLAIKSQAQQIVQRERARIARDIHDDLTASLTQLVLHGEVAKSGLPDGSEPQLQVARICEKARSLSSAMNEIIWVVNSQRDTFRDFTSYICKYAETFLQPTSIRCRFDLDEEVPDLPCDLGVRRNLFLGVKEALNNAVRHSGAGELVLSVHLREDQMVVTVEDNGKGFNPESSDQLRNGLSNMSQRAAEAGGVCRLSSRPGAGCRVEFVTPLVRSPKFYSKFWKFAAPSRIANPGQSSTTTFQP